MQKQENNCGFCAVENRNEGELNVKYIFDPMYSPVYANGAYGGPISENELAVHFYLERPAIPKRSKVRYSREQIIEEASCTGTSGGNEVIRQIESGVVMNLEEAKALASWIEGSIRQMKEMYGRE